jgi:hypothetical protein
MNLFGKRLEGFRAALAVLIAILVVFSAALLVCCGLCGLSLATSGNAAGSGATNSWASSMIVAALISLAAIVLSMLGIAIVLIAWGINSRVRRRRENLAGPSDPN